jgi:hypothetical protein
MSQTAKTASAHVSEADLIIRATRALEAKAKRDGFMFEQPSKLLSEFDRAESQVILRNCNGAIAVFGYDRQRDRLSWVHLPYEDQACCLIQPDGTDGGAP